MSTQALESAPASYLETLRGNLGLYSFGIDPASPPYETPQSPTAGDAEFQDAVSKCRSTGLPLVLRPGTHYLLSEKVALDWDKPLILGWGARVTFDASCPIGFELGSASGASQLGKIFGLSIYGAASDGDFSDNQTLINMLDLKPKRWTFKSTELFYAKTGIASRYSDYTELNQLLIRGCETGVFGGPASNEMLIRNVAFLGTDAATNSVSLYHIYAEGLDQLTMEGGEFGDGDYGLYAPSNNNEFTCNVEVTGGRSERVRIAEFVWGTGTGTTYRPSHLGIKNRVFMCAEAEDARNLIEVDNGDNVVVKHCRGSVMSSSHNLLKSFRNTDKIHMENCSVNAGNIFQDSAGSNQNTRVITQGW